MGPGVYLVDPYGPGPPHQHAPQHHPPPPRAPTPPATPRSPATFLCDPLYPLPSPLSNCLKDFHAQEPHRVLLNFIMAVEERLSYPSDGLCFLEVSTVCIA